MGGSSGYTFQKSSPDQLRQQIRAAELAASEAQFAPKLAQKLNDLLSRVNDRDADLTARRLADVRQALEDKIESSFDLRFGGSVAKHTYVDGLSDVDTLLILRTEDESEARPKDLLNQVADRLAEKLPRTIEVSRGRVAITLKYSPDEEIQIIPAIRADNKLHVPAWNANEWSPIDPEKFARGLTKRNEKCAMKLVPTIKLAKSINATLPEPQRLSGYHIESLAIAAFRDYAGPHVVEKMLPYFFKRMSSLVLSPMKDSTGQSVYVDEHLGRSNSQQRQQAAHLLDRIARRMENATAAGSLDQWKAIIGE